ncbi:hypothetical protein G3570_03205 [Balneolaceae bacterium YR4-1]|uniref:Replication-associated protein ORF2/G2P domain-containing protein n=1 Tax=Halalkalibaculum roseum TaxID=2709311 RepID=A0A6M1SX26_9BACT|nr:hypothetical protein [Halalkalibaculum roseum]NGP75624.1 hypothetical protein [Halalkalibaculum roseum]
MRNENYETQQQYANWLSNERWDYFFTGTFRYENISVNGSRRCAQRFFRGFTTLELGVLFIESGKLYGKVHLHGLLRFRPGHRPSARTIWSWWFDRYGRAKVEEIDSAEAVSSYCCKYVTKQMKDETFFLV